MIIGIGSQREEKEAVKCKVHELVHTEAGQWWEECDEAVCVKVAIRPNSV